MVVAAAPNGVKVHVPDRSTTVKGTHLALSDQASNAKHTLHLTSRDSGKNTDAAPVDSRVMVLLSQLARWKTSASVTLDSIIQKPEVII